MNYISSIILKYGDNDQAKEDVKTLNEILGRQGASIFIDVIAESIGRAALNFKLSNENVESIKTNITKELIEAIEERT